LNGKKDIVELLVKHKVDANLKNEFDRSAIQETLEKGWVEIGQMLAPVSCFEEG
jgi:ankyrin repeat protein